MPHIQFLKLLAVILPLGFPVALVLLRFAQGATRLRAIADAFLCWTVVSYAATEIFSFFHAISLLPFLLLWAVADGWLVYRLWRADSDILRFFRLPFSTPALILGFIICVTLFIACTGAPNNWDSQTYHLPRIEHWIQDRSLAYFPTPNGRQNDFGPLAEILLLQLRVLSGSDFLYPLIQWISMLCSVALVFRIARQLGGSDTQCWLASVFAASLPIGILESTSTQNDYVVAALLACFVTLGLEALSRTRPPLILILASACAAALSGIVKPTGYFSGIGFAVWFAFALSQRVDIRTIVVRGIGVIAVLLLIMGPPASRYLAAHDGMQTQLSQTSTNGSFGIRQTLDNLIRNGMLNFNTGIPDVDRISNRAAEALSAGLGLDKYRADTSFRSFYSAAPPVGLSVFHEDFGPSTIHSLLLILALLVTATRWSAPNAGLKHTYCVALLAGLIVRTAILRWDPWQVRYQLPLFILAAPFFATAFPESWLSRRILRAVHILLALVAVPPLLFNQSRQLVPLQPNRPFPVASPRPSYLAQTDNARLFANAPHLRKPFENVIKAISLAGVSQIGVLSHAWDEWEYPIWRLLREHGMTYPLRIEHVSTDANVSYPLGPFRPEAIIWVNPDKAPASIVIGGREFVRNGPSDVVAIFFTGDMNLGHFWSDAVPDVVEGVASRSEGIYEDGWLAQNGQIAIQPGKAGTLVLKGQIPGGVGIDRQEIEIVGPRGQVIQRQLVAGPFEIDIPIDPDQTDITFRFLNAAVLPQGDGRTVGALLTSSEFRPKQ